ncbi:hypothetical protein [Parasediminibacterium sp. JCM 36343]|uniref:hypothetical protein n=1 Tax=Parasediminibacterium sp. JCM 36343 TaxID=3374279 RepID=UPI00397DAF3D
MEELTTTLSLFELEIDFDAQDSLKESARWSKFIAIVYSILFGFWLLYVCLFAAFANTMLQYLPLQFRVFYQGKSFVIWLIIILITVAFGFYLCQILRFPNQISRAIKQNDQQALENGFVALKICCIISGITGIGFTLFKIISILKYSNLL